MATSITLSGPVAYAGGSSTSSKFVGYNADKNCVLRYSFTTPSGGYITSLNLSAQFAWYSAQGYSSVDGSKQSIPTRVKITTDSSSHVNAGSSTTDYNATLPTFVNFSAGANVQNSISTTVSGILLSPSTTYYMYFYPSSSRHHMFYFYDYTGTDHTAISYDSLVNSFTLTLNKDSGVSSFTGAGSYAVGATATTVATAKTGYHLVSYTGTTSDGSGTSTWTGCSGLTSHTDTWSMYQNRTITVNSAADTYTLTYNANGGTGAPGNQTKTYGTAITLSSTKPTRASTSSTFTITGNGNGGTSKSITATKTISYTFAGWSTSASGSAQYNAGGSCNLNGSSNGATITLYAVWTPTTTYSNNTISALGSTTRSSTSAGSYTVSFNANGGSCSTSSLSAARTTSYTFLGWGSSSSASSSLSSSTSYTSATTVYARWSSSTSTSAITLPSASRTGYTFKGWSTSSSASSGSTGSYTPSGNVTLYATWAANSYTNTISHWLWGFNGEGNNGGGTAYNIANTTFIKTYGSTVTYTASDATTIPNGCYLASGFGSGSYADTWTGYNFGTSFTQPAKSTSVEYDYLPYTYTITYNLNGGTNSSSNPSTYNVLYGVTFSDPTLAGAKFLGWYINGTKVTGINPGENATFSSASDLYSRLSARMTGNITVEAKWEAQGLVYIDNGSSFDAYQIFIDNGSSWDQYVPYIDNGSSWDLYS